MERRHDRLIDSSQVKNPSKHKKIQTNEDKLYEKSEEIEKLTQKLNSLQSDLKLHHGEIHLLRFQLTRMQYKSNIHLSKYNPEFWSSWLVHWTKTRKLMIEIGKFAGFVSTTRSQIIPNKKEDEIDQFQTIPTQNLQDGHEYCPDVEYYRRLNDLLEAQLRCWVDSQIKLNKQLVWSEISISKRRGDSNNIKISNGNGNHNHQNFVRVSSPYKLTHSSTQTSPSFHVRKYCNRDVSKQHVTIENFQSFCPGPTNVNYEYTKTIPPTPAAEVSRLSSSLLGETSSLVSSNLSGPSSQANQFRNLTDSQMTTKSTSPTALTQDILRYLSANKEFAQNSTEKKKESTIIPFPSLDNIENLLPDSNHRTTGIPVKPIVEQKLSYSSKTYYPTRSQRVVLLDISNKNSIQSQQSWQGLDKPVCKDERMFDRLPYDLVEQSKHQNFPHHHQHQAISSKLLANTKCSSTLALKLRDPSQQSACLNKSGSLLDLSPHSFQKAIDRMHEENQVAHRDIERIKTHLENMRLSL